jgi:histidinol-phosphate/aromatic aminotransferase/cobyric acid decarboxylase-like protein
VNVRRKRPLELEEALRQGLDDPEYPSDHQTREALAERHGREPDEVLPLNGASEAFWLLAHALRPRRAVCVHPSFTEGETALRAAGAAVKRLLTTPPDWALEPAAVGNADLVLVTNPCNPTGRIEPAATVAELATTGRLLVVDESFMEFAGNDATLDQRRDVVVIRSATKLWSLAGIRAGYLLAPAELVRQLEAARQPWSVNAPALAALRAIAHLPAIAARIASEVALERDWLVTALRTIPGVRVWPSAANFVLLEQPLESAADRLRSCGIAVRPCDDFPGLSSRFIRVAVRAVDENRLLVQKLAEVIDGR